MVYPFSEEQECLTMPSSLIMSNKPNLNAAVIRLTFSQDLVSYRKNVERNFYVNQLFLTYGVIHLASIFRSNPVCLEKSHFSNLLC